MDNYNPQAFLEHVLIKATSECVLSFCVYCLVFFIKKTIIIIVCVYFCCFLNPQINKNDQERHIHFQLFSRSHYIGKVQELSCYSFCTSKNWSKSTNNMVTSFTGSYTSKVCHMRICKYIV